MALLIENQLFPPVLSFALALSRGKLLIEACENYNKGSYRNKYAMMNSGGITRLSVPLNKGKNNSKPIKEITISYAENWQQNHLRTIQTNYGKSPFFEDYFPEIQRIYSIDFDFLFDFNLKVIALVVKLLNIDLAIDTTDVFQFTYPKNDSGIKDYRNMIVPKMDTCDYHFKPYPQVFEDRHGFIPNLSILDLLFCMGPESVLILKETYFKNTL
ncbi:MAG: hypothetical protein EA362_05690 [Saprospirales bacterium]|nr:MAG: hypothetical protein EA362_05690 [Saprospirales bacterium]